MRSVSQLPPVPLDGWEAARMLGLGQDSQAAAEAYRQLAAAGWQPAGYNWDGWAVLQPPTPPQREQKKHDR